MIKQWRGDRMAKARKARKLTQVQFAKRLNVTQSAVAGWERNFNPPSPDKYRDIEKVLKVKMDYLFNLSDKETSEQITTELEKANVEIKKIKLFDEVEDKQVPIFETISYADGYEATDQIIGYTSAKYGDFALKIFDETMMPSVPEGATLIIKKTSAAELRNGEMVAVIINNEKATIKRWYSEPALGFFTLWSENKSNFRPQNFLFSRIDLDVCILGKVVEIKITPEVLA